MASPITPPLGKPVRDLKTANHKDGFYWELVSRESTQFQANAPVKRGTKYQDIVGANQRVIDLHTDGLWFCEEIVPFRSSDVGNMPGDRFVIWVWSTDRLAQNATNADITYLGESTSHPVYARDSIIRRDAYEASPTVAAQSTLTGLIGVTITAAGTGYTHASGTVGTATVDFVCSGGAIIAGIVTKEGSSITNGAAITITGDGAGATATAVIQPAGAILVHQEKRELDADSNLSHEFVRVIRVYQTLPGPWIYSTRLDPDGAVVTVATRTNIAASITSSEALAGGAWTKTTKRGEESSYIADEVVETRAIPGTDRISKRFNRFGGLDLIKKKLVAGTTTPTNTTYTVQELQAETALVASLIETIIATGSPVTLYQDADPSIPGSRMTVSYSLVLAAAAVPDNTALITYETLEYPDNPLMRVLKTSTFSLPEDADGNAYTVDNPLIEYRDAGFSFPTLFYSQVWNDAGTTRDAREGFSTIVPHRVETYFSTTRQDITPFQIIEADYLVYSMHMKGLINNGLTFTKTGYANVVIGVDIGYRCTPSKDAYIALVTGLWADAVIVGGSCTIWRGGIYKTEIHKVRLQ